MKVVSKYTVHDEQIAVLATCTQTLVPVNFLGRWCLVLIHVPQE